MNKIIKNKFENEFENICEFETDIDYGASYTTAFVDCDDFANILCDEFGREDFENIYNQVVEFVENLGEFNGCFLKAIN